MQNHQGAAGPSAPSEPDRSSRWGRLGTGRAHGRPPPHVPSGPPRPPRGGRLSRDLRAPRRGPAPPLARRAGAAAVPLYKGRACPGSRCRREDVAIRAIRYGRRGAWGCPGVAWGFLLLAGGAVREGWMRLRRSCRSCGGRR